MNECSFIIIYLCRKLRIMSSGSKRQNKREALIKATIDLVNNDGFHAAPMTKIAKKASVSPGTIYLYFESKQDLINQVYIEVKTDFTRVAFKDFTTELDVEEGFEKIWMNMAHFKLNNVDRALFLSQCDNTPMVDEASRKEGLKHLNPLLELWEEGKKKGIIKNVSSYILYAFTVYPMAFLLNVQQQKLFTLTATTLEDAYTMAWNSIKQ